MKEEIWSPLDVLEDSNESYTKGSPVPVSTGTPLRAAVTECLFPVLTATSMYDEKSEKLKIMQISKKIVTFF